MSSEFWSKVGTNEEAVRQATNLNWRSKGLNADDGKAIACLISSGSLDKLTWLGLWDNQIGDEGIKAFSSALSSALATLTWLDLDSNQIGDEGMKAFSGALSSGALGSLLELEIGNNPASNSAKDTMKAVASSRGISLSIWIE